MDASRLRTLDLEECLARLRAHEVGRIAVTTDTGPVIVPVNYRLVESLDLRWIALRTTAGGLIDEPGTHVAFEIDEIGPGHRGSSVLVRGILEHVDPGAAGYRERYDSFPWVPGRDVWLAISPFSITGRELRPGDDDWAFGLAAYL
jgi:nitroimidazol reductase NimA-like FMN-containing flavoprotein (pyridoxamine 5'-phosphate oxidase superfamily)